jgi:hypothetical protein
MKSTNRVFYEVAQALRSLSRLTGFTYNEINVLIYYFIIPFTWMILLDNILHIQYFKLAGFIFCIGFYAGCRDFRKYSDWLFFKSVIFLNFFNRFGSNCIRSSVWICVSLPILIYTILFFLAFKSF